MSKINAHYKDASDVKKLKENQFLSVRQYCLTDLDLQMIINEFDKKVNDRNYEFLGEIVSKLEFFKKYSQAIKISLIKLAKLVHYSKGSTLFHQGDVGELMYIILKGGCYVRVRKINAQGKVENPVVVTL